MILWITFRVDPSLEGFRQRTGGAQRRHPTLTMFLQVSPATCADNLRLE